MIFLMVHYQLHATKLLRNTLKGDDISTIRRKDGLKVQKQVFDKSRRVVTNNFPKQFVSGFSTFNIIGDGCSVLERHIKIIILFPISPMLLSNYQYNYKTFV